ncbi:hypothetical protein [uncultured Shewanella sp.]|uniref:hypothetical protein n=1 Tax=uncultured Shewanella sp. TaxID=173975 RepID=UPI00261C1F56|nr:hypothetical protein [uncultured Shewanella sp.]
MKKIAFFVLLISWTSLTLASEPLFIDGDEGFMPSAQDKYNGRDPRVFVQNEIVARTKMSSLSSSQGILQPTLTGIISLQLKPQIDLDSFIQDYPVNIHWRSDFNLVDVKPSALLNLTHLADIKYFFELISELKASDNVIWVEAGRADRRQRIK